MEEIHSSKLDEVVPSLIKAIDGHEVDGFDGADDVDARLKSTWSVSAFVS